MIDVQPQARDVRAVEVQKTEVTAQAVPVRQAGKLRLERRPLRVSSSRSPGGSDEPERGPLFSAEEAASLRSRWDAIQVGFVDEPRRSVQQADTLVAATMKRLAEQFAAETLEPGRSMGSRLRRVDRRLAYCAAPLPFVLRPPTVYLTLVTRTSFPFACAELPHRKFSLRPARAGNCRPFAA